MELRPARWDDLEEVAVVIGAQNRAATGVAGIRVEQLRNDWSRPGFVLGEDNLVAEGDGRVVGYAALSPSRELVLAAADDRLSDALLDCISIRARARGDHTLSALVQSEGGPLDRLVRRHRFRLERKVLLMWRELVGPVAEPALPAGITLRTYRPGDAAAVHSLLEEAYGAWDPLYVPIGHADWVSWMTRDPEFDPDVWWLAERDGALVGCALHWKSGWLKDIAVLDSERGRGLGAALVNTGLAEFARRGARRVGLKVDSGNPTGATRLYDRLGFVTTSREAVWSWTL